MSHRFKIIFDEISKIEQNDQVDPNLVAEVQELSGELEEIDELRRLAMDITDPEPQTYTAT